MSKPTAQLLEENGQSFGGAEEQDGIDLGNIEALAENIAGKEEGDLAYPEITQCLFPIAALRLAHKHR